jgi:hypothetical protein
MEGSLMRSFLRGLDFNPIISDKATGEQEPVVQGYIDKLISRLHEQIQAPDHGIINSVKWYSYTTFDVLGVLTFGESFPVS